MIQYFPQLILHPYFTRFPFTSDHLIRSKGYGVTAIRSKFIVNSRN